MPEQVHERRISGLNFAQEAKQVLHVAEEGTAVFDPPGVRLGVVDERLEQVVNGQGKAGVELGELCLQSNLAVRSIILARDVERGDLADARASSEDEIGHSTRVWGGPAGESSPKTDTYDGLLRVGLPEEHECVCRQRGWRIFG